MNISYKYSLRILALLVLLTVAGCGDDFTEPPAPEGLTIAATAGASDQFNILSALLTKTGLAGSLANNNAGTFTVFAPTDDAFLAFLKNPTGVTLPTGTTITDEASAITLINGLTTSNNASLISALSVVLTYHIVSSKITSTALQPRQTVATLGTSRLDITKRGTEVFLNANQAQVVTADLQASNGVIHAINAVALAPSSTVLGTLGNVTVGYNTNPPTVTGPTAAGAGTYDILGAAIARSGLAPTLLPNLAIIPDITVFAPTDAAFISFLGAADEASAIQTVRSMPAADLATILRYHVVSGRILSTDLTNGQQVTTLGGTFKVNIDGSKVTITDNNATSTDATVTSANIRTNTGVIHRIDQVLVPN